MRGSILSVAGGVFCLILSANQGYAGAAKGTPPTCTTPPGAGTPNSCGVQVPVGTQQVDPPGNIVDPATTFEAGAIDGFEVGSGTGNGTTFNQFLGFTSFSNGFDPNQSIANSVIEFDGTFTANGEDTFGVCFNPGSFVQLFINGQSVLTAANTDDSVTGSCSVDPFATASGLGLAPDSLNNFVLDYYAYTGDPNPDGNNDPNVYDVSFSINGSPADDSLPGGTVPEPASLSLFVAALAGLGIVRRRRKRG